MSADKYEVVIGLEVHAQLSTQSKIFSWSSAAFGAEPNTHTDPVCLGPAGHAAGAERAPRSSRRCAWGWRRAARSASAAASRASTTSIPTCPRAFRSRSSTSRSARAARSRFRLHGERRSVRLVRIHMEEDAGKNLHAAAGVSFVDYNRAGVPLCEIVSEPDIRSAEEAAEYVRAVRALVRYLGICDGNMEEGSLRCDANVSLRLRGATKYGTKTELKNMNSFKNVRDAIEHEVKRQAALLDRGERVVQETRLWDAARGMSAAMRSKEQAHDYRYFPEPDLPPLVVTDGELAEARASLPELPEDRFARYTTSSGLSPQDAGVLVAEKEVADYFDATVAAGAPPKRAANWVINEVLARVDDPRKLGAADVAVRAGGAGRADRAHRVGHDLRQAGQGRLRAHVDRAPPRRRDRRGRRAGAGLRQRRDRRGVPQGGRRQPRGGRALPRRQRQADRLLRGRGDEGDRRQGQPQDASTRSCSACWHT